MAYRSHHLHQFGVSAWFLQATMLVLSTTFTPSYGFNLEPHTARIFSYPSTSLHDRGSYFGYTIALQRNSLDNSSWLLVGAPRANSTLPSASQIKEPGAIFACNLGNPQNTQCQELDIKRDENEITTKVGSGLGSALDAQPTFKDGRQAIGVCAPRLTTDINKSYHMNGVCYWLNGSLPNASTYKISPLSDSKEQLRVYRNTVLHEYDLGQAGFSIHFPDNPTEMIVGGPGITNWRGSVIRLMDSPNRRQQPFGEQNVPKPYHTSQISDFDLNGYAVTSGHFISKNELLYASGSPTGAGAKGQVIVFAFLTGKNSPFDFRVNHRGDQLGENFGASLASADVNGDGLSELVVGSPTFSEEDKIDMGRILVFYVAKNGSAARRESFHGMRSTMARFGTTVASPGDLNHDDYEDVAVGAPFEDEGKGAVYIYMGSRLGLRGNFAQRLTPKDFPSIPIMTGFGIAISRGADVDSNEYPDLAIGSFMTGQAIVVYSRSVASIKGELKFHPPTLHIDDKRLNFQACFSYEGYKVPDSINITVNITLDYNHPFQRAHFNDTGDQFKEFLVMGNKSKELCSDYEVSIKSLKSDPRRPILVKMDFELQEDKKRLTQQPKTDPEEERGIISPINIVTDCIEDGNETCQFDMRAEAKFQMNRATIGRDTRLVLEISVSNSGESAFLPNITVIVQRPFAIFLPASHDCIFPTRDNRTVIVCQLLNPIQNDIKDSVNVTVDASALSDETKDLTVEITAAGDGIDVNITNNRLTITLQLQAEAELTLQGSSFDEKIIYQRLDEHTVNATLPTSSFMHHYTLVKAGPTPIGSVLLEVDIPIKFSGETESNVITVYTPKTNFLSQTFMCSVKGTTLAIDKGNTEDSTSALSSDESKEAPVTKIRDEILVFTEPVRGKIRSGNSSFQFGCLNPQVSCAKLSCQINSLPKETNSADLFIKMKVNFTTLAKYMSPQLGAVVTSNAMASIQSIAPGLAFAGKRDDGIQTDTHFVPSSIPAGSVSWWIILLAALGGLLLLILLAYLLYRLGFFRRKKHEELKALKGHDEDANDEAENTVDKESAKTADA